MLVELVNKFGRKCLADVFNVEARDDGRTALSYLQNTKTDDLVRETMVVPLPFDHVKELLTDGQRTFQIPQMKPSDIETQRKIHGYKGDMPKIDYFIR